MQELHKLGGIQFKHGKISAVHIYNSIYVYECRKFPKVKLIVYIQTTIQRWNRSEFSRPDSNGIFQNLRRLTGRSILLDSFI